MNEAASFLPPVRMRPKYIRRDFVIAKVNELRKTLGIVGPFFSIEQVIKSYGIELEHVLDLENPIAVRYDGRHIIFMTPTAVPERDRWSLVHEFSHIYLGHFEDYMVDRIIDGHNVDILTNRERYILEREADIFTTELLLPKEWVLKLVNYPLSLGQVGRLKNFFGVSWEAMFYRLEELGIAKKDEII